MKRFCYSVLGGAIALTAMASPALTAPPAGTRVILSSSGASDTSKPGPNNTLSISSVTPVGGVQTIHLYWTEPYDDTSNTNGTGTGQVGSGPVITRKVLFRTDHVFDPLLSTDYGASATPVPGNPAIVAGGTAMNVDFTVPAEGVTYYFALLITDDATNTTYGLPVSQFVAVTAAPPAGDPGGGSGGQGGACTAAPAGSWFSDFMASFGRRIGEGSSILVLVLFLTGIGVALRRP